MTETALLDKYAHRFRVQDTDGDGFVDEGDLVRRAEMLLAGMGEPVRSVRGAAVLAGAREYWRGLAKLAGVAEDGQLAETEFVDALVQAYESGTIGDLVRPSVEAHVALVDGDGDGTVDVEEFLRGQQAVGMPAGQAREAFAALDRDGDGRLTVEEWQQAVVEYYTTAERGSSGELVMGLRA
jgi:Ca2+-binding EF-hand superfamily protein